MSEVDSDCTLHRSQKEIGVEPPATVGSGPCSPAFHDVSHDFCLHCIGAERVKTVLVRPASESDCIVTDCGSHVKRVLTLSEKLTLTLAFSLFFFWARRGVEGEGKSCRPPLSISHVPPLT